MLTVAGHDHLVAAAAAGAARAGTVFDSFGTAEAFRRRDLAVPGPDQVAHLVALGMNVYPHVVSGHDLRARGRQVRHRAGRVLRLLGATTPEARQPARRGRVATAPSAPGTHGVSARPTA